MDLTAFLQIDHPEFSAIEPGAETTDLTFFGSPWNLSTILRRSSMLSGSWINSGSHWVPTNYLGEEKTVTVDNPSTAKGFYKIQ